MKGGVVHAAPPFSLFMLNSTKEGIVVQFLPEAKDFGVSLNQVL